MNFERKLLPIKGDASFRKFYRQKIKKKKFNNCIFKKRKDKKFTQL